MFLTKFKTRSLDLILTFLDQLYNFVTKLTIKLPRGKWNFDFLKCTKLKKGPEKSKRFLM